MATHNPLSSVIAALKKEQVIPDVIPEFTPTVPFSVVWPRGNEAALGNKLTVESVLEEPEIKFTPMAGEREGKEVSYTLVMTDPDAPSRAHPKFREFRHWVITGVKTREPTAGGTTALKTQPSTTAYRPPGAPPGTGFHRYVFLLFEEPASGFTVPHGAPEWGSVREDRRSWKAFEFGRRYGLKLVGANFFLTQSSE